MNCILSNGLECPIYDEYVYLQDELINSKKQFHREISRLKTENINLTHRVTELNTEITRLNNEITKLTNENNVIKNNKFIKKLQSALQDINRKFSLETIFTYFINIRTHRNSEQHYIDELYDDQYDQNVKVCALIKIINTSSPQIIQDMCDSINNDFRNRRKTPVSVNNILDVIKHVNRMIDINLYPETEVEHVINQYFK